MSRSVQDHCARPDHCDPIQCFSQYFTTMEKKNNLGHHTAKRAAAKVQGGAFMCAAVHTCALCIYIKI